MTNKPVVWVSLKQEQTPVDRSLFEKLGVSPASLKTSKNPSYALSKAMRDTWINAKD